MKSKSENKTAVFNKESLQRFKSTYAQVSQSDQEYFFFEGNEYFVGYAKYLIQYLEFQFNLNSKEHGETTI
jgi:hypothetical protein